MQNSDTSKTEPESGAAVPGIDAGFLLDVANQSKQTLIDMTRDLVRIDSQTPPSDTRKTADIAASLLPVGGNVETVFCPSEHPVMNLVARLKGTRPGPRLILSGHLDTYPIGDAERWTRDPLGGEVVDERLYGRGSADMKGGIAAQILLMRVFAERVVDFPGEIVLALAGDEERMGELGTQVLIDTVPAVRGDAVLVADVGSPSIIRCGEKGMIWIDVTATGREAHGAHVHRGDNAIDKLIAALTDLKRLEEIAIECPADVAAAMAAAEPLSEPLGGAGERETMSRITVNLGQIDGGLSANLVPAKAVGRLDIRVPMGISVATVEARITSMLEARPDVSFEVTRRYEATWTPVDDPITRACVDAASRVLSEPVAVNMRVGGSDARLWRRAGIPTIVSGLTPYNLGAPDEYLDINELCQVAAIQMIAAANFLESAV